MITNKVTDYILGGTGMSSPFWASALTDVNEVLTTVSLIGGLFLIGLRLWKQWKE